MISMAPLKGVVAAFAGPLTVLRSPGVTMVNGRRVDGARVALAGARGSCYPVTGYRMAQYQQGQQLTGAIDVYSLVSLFVADERVEQPGDIVVHGGDNFLIFARQPWPAGFHVYTAGLVKQ